MTDGYSLMLMITEIIARREGSAYIMTMSSKSALILRSYHNKSFHHACVIMMAFIVNKGYDFLNIIVLAYHKRSQEEYDNLQSFFFYVVCILCLQLTHLKVLSQENACIMDMSS